MADPDRPVAHAALGVLLFLACAAPAYAQTTIAVTTTADDLAVDGYCSLREAVIAANTNRTVDSCPAGGPTQDRIIVPPGTYALSFTGPGEDAARTGDLDVIGALSLTGADPATTIIDGGSLSNPLTADRVIDVRQTGSLSLYGLTIRGGRCYAGGGILNAGWLYTYDVHVEDNVTNGDPALSCQGGSSLTGGGAGIYNEGRLLLTWAVVAGNRALGPTAMTDAESSGGGLLNRGLAQVQDTTFEGNFAAGGGGVYNEGALLLSSSHITGNLTRFLAGGLQNNGFATVTYSAITGNTDGGILNGESWSTRTGTLSLQNSTVSGNESLRLPGSVLNLRGEVKIGGSTISANTSLSFGAGLAGGPIFLANSIVANGADGDCAQPVESWGYNLDTDGSCGLTATGDLPHTDPVLGVLHNNGGPTPTHALLPGSPAIDWIPIGQCRLHRGQFDQRFVPRPQPAGGACDIGAYERSPDDAEGAPPVR